jgi:hypothetical protein
MTDPQAGKFDTGYKCTCSRCDDSPSIASPLLAEHFSMAGHEAMSNNMTMPTRHFSDRLELVDK